MSDSPVKQPWRRQLLVVALTLVLALVMSVGFYLGQQAAYRGMGAKPKVYRAMQEQLLSLRNALGERETELEILRTRSEVDRHALELVRRDMAAQQEDIAALEEGMAFYRSLIAPGEVSAGLSLRKLQLVAADAPRSYLFRIVVQQESRKYEQLKGQLRVTLAGEQAGETVEYSLAQLSDDVEGDSIPLQLRYFQVVEGKISLPEGFVPAVFQVSASTTAPRKLDVAEQFSWQLDERFTYVGK